MNQIYQCRDIAKEYTEPIMLVDDVLSRWEMQCMKMLKFSEHIGGLVRCSMDARYYVSEHHKQFRQSVKDLVDQHRNRPRHQLVDDIIALR